MIDELRALAESNGLTIDYMFDDQCRITNDFHVVYLVMEDGMYFASSNLYINRIRVTSAQQVIDIAKGNHDEGPKQPMDDTRASGSKRTVDGVIDALERIIAELESIEEDCKIHRMGYCDGAVELARNAACHSLDLAMLFKSSRKPQT